MTARDLASRLRADRLLDVGPQNARFRTVSILVACDALQYGRILLGDGLSLAKSLFCFRVVIGML